MRRNQVLTVAVVLNPGDQVGLLAAFSWFDAEFQGEDFAGHAGIVADPQTKQPRPPLPVSRAFVSNYLPAVDPQRRCVRPRDPDLLFGRVFDRVFGVLP